MKYKTLLCVVLAAVTLAVYAQTANHRFINFDDTIYVTDNPHVQGGLTGANLAWAFTTVTASNWHPLTWLSHMADVQLFGLNPRGHHLTSVFLHTASALLLFLLLAQITGFVWQSLFVAALFALHPLHVESVAWVAERKDVLSCFFWLLTLLLYARYVKRPALNRYLLALLSFAVGLLAKPMLVTLPVVLLLLDYWPLNRFRPGPAAAGPSLASLIKEKLPFFLLSLISSAITIYAQRQGGAMKNLDAAPLGLRFENSLVAYARYLGETLWPHDLAVLYPFPQSLPLWQAVCSFLLLALITVATVGSRRRYPYLLVGWGWFLVTLVPVIGLVQVGGQSMADRYTYIPIIGLFIMAAWLVPDLARGWRYRLEFLAITAALVVTASAAATLWQLRYWQDSISLFRHTLAVTPANYLILNNYGIALDERGDHDGAIKVYREVFRIKPNSIKARINLGAALVHEGKFEEAIGQYEQALKIDPENADVQLDLAILLMKEGGRDAALSHYETALRLEPYSTRAPINMGAALAKAGRLAEAADFFSQALRIDPASLEAQFNLGVALAKQGKTEEAARHFSELLRLKPDTEPARRWLEVLRGRSAPLSPRRAHP